MRYSSRNLVRKTHTFRPTGTVGTTLVYYCLILFALLSLFLVSALSTRLPLRHAVFILLAVLRVYFIISGLCVHYLFATQVSILVYYTFVRPP